LREDRIRIISGAKVKTKGKHRSIMSISRKECLDPEEDGKKYYPMLLPLSDHDLSAPFVPPVEKRMVNLSGFDADVLSRLEKHKSGYQTPINALFDYMHRHKDIEASDIIKAARTRPSHPFYYCFYEAKRLKWCVKNSRLYRSLRPIRHQQ